MREFNFPKKNTGTLPKIEMMERGKTMKGGRAGTTVMSTISTQSVCCLRERLFPPRSYSIHWDRQWNCAVIFVISLFDDCFFCWFDENVWLVIFEKALTEYVLVLRIVLLFSSFDIVNIVSGKFLFLFSKVKTLILKTRYCDIELIRVIHQETLSSIRARFTRKTRE